MVGLPLSREHAKALAQAFVAENDVSILDAFTEEHLWGWVFYYQANAFLVTGRLGGALAGNAPLIVERSTGRVIPLGTARPTSYYIANYLATGDPHREPGNVVCVCGWEVGASALAAILAIRSATGSSLRTAKKQVEACLSGAQVAVVSRDSAAAVQLVQALSGCGFSARQLAAGDEG